MTTKIKSGVISNNAITSAHISSGAISSAHLTGIDTDDVGEGSSNLYFTNARADARVNAVLPNTGSLTEGSNLYFTTARVDSHLSGGTGVTYSSGAISIGQSVATSASPTFANLTLTGNLNITGDVDSVSVTDLDVTDKTITVGVGGTASANDGAGLVVDGASASILWDNSNGEWDINKPINVTGRIVATGISQFADVNIPDNNAIRFGSSQDLQIFHNATDSIIYNGTGALMVRANDFRIQAADASSTKMIINSSGNVGIGTDNPLMKLDIRGGNMQIGGYGGGSDYGIVLTPADSSSYWHIYNDTGGELVFGRNITIGSTEFARFDSSGKLGLGVADPQHQLDISDTISTKIQLSGGTNQNGIKFAAAGNDGVSSSTYYLGVGSDLMSGTDYGVLLLDVTNNRSILFQDESTNRLSFNNNAMYVTNAGNVGIGVVPTTLLHIKGTGDAIRVESTNAGSGGAQMDLLHFSASPADEDVNAAINFGGYYSGSSSAYASAIRSIWTDVSARHGRLEFYTRDDSAFSTAMTITHDSKVGIGTTSPSNKLQITTSGAGNPYIGFDHTGDNPYMEMQRWSGTASDYFGTRIKSYQSVLAFENTGSSAAAIGSQTFTERVRIDASGNVGIGITNPGYNLAVSSKVTVGDSPANGLSGNTIHVKEGSNSGIHFPLVIGGGTHTAGAAFGLAFDPEGYGNRNKIAILAEGTGVGYSRGRLHFALDSVSDSGQVTLADSKMCIRDNGNIGIGSQVDAPGQLLTVATSTNYDPPGLGNSNANFSVLKKDNAAGGNYGIITGVSSDGNVWKQVQRVDGTATAYNLYLQPSGGSVGVGIPQNHTYIPNLTVPFRVGKTRTGVGNDSDYLTKMSIDAIGYGGSNYQFGAIDFTGGDTAGASGNHYGRIGCSSMVGTNNQETGSLEFYVRAPSFNMNGDAHAIKITGKADTSSAGSGTTRNGVLFTYQGLAIDRSWANYPCINVMNSTPYSSSSSTQAELRIHGNNVSSASYPGTSGSDFSVVTRSDGGYATGSDRRRKKNITTIDNALSTVKQLTGKRFQTVNSTNEVQEHVSKNGYKFGFIAQEVEDIIPETVQYHADEDDGTDNYNSAYAMDYGSVVALLVNAIKEQDTTIQDLKSRIETLEG